MMPFRMRCQRENHAARHASLGLLVCAIAACGGGGSGSGGGSSAQVCPEATGTYSVGDRGPAGGWIFYVDGDDSHDFDYLEAAPENITDNGGTTVLYTWASSYGGAFLIGGTSEAIGSGEGNTQRGADALRTMVRVIALRSARLLMSITVARGFCRPRMN